MTRFSFKGDVESVRPQHVDFISSVLEKNGFSAAEVVIAPLGKAGDNYMSNVKKIEVTENEKTLKIVAKLATDSEMMRKMANMAEVFNNEHIIYTEVLPKFRELQKRADVPEEDLLRFAECYGTSLVKPDEIILLENMNEKNYGMLDKMNPLPNDCVKSALKQLAIYHSLSYVLKHKEPETFATMVSKITDMYSMSISEQTDIFLKKMEDDEIALMTEEKHKKVLKGSTTELLNHEKKLRCDIGSKHSVIQQGDGWTNNILFKHEEGNSAPDICVLIDYQMAKENNPCFDILYMLFNSTSHEQRLKHYTEFIDHYHNQLDNSLNYFGLKAAYTYPRDQLDADLKRYAKFSLASCVMVSNFILRKVDEAEKVQEAMMNSAVMDSKEMLTALMVTDEETIALYKNKVEGLIDSFIEFGLI